jgi:hypothetical protein
MVILDITRFLWNPKIKRRDHTHLSFWDVCLPSHAFWVMQCTATFQQCMISIVFDMVECFLEIFIDDFSIFGSSFEKCLHHLTLVLVRWKEKNLVQNWEKCHFMVKKGIVLGHVITHRGIEVDKAKMDLISNLPPPRTVKEICSFLGHAEFYRRFIQNFRKISKPLCKLLVKETPFVFDKDYKQAFGDLKKILTSHPLFSHPTRVCILRSCVMLMIIHLELLWGSMLINSPMSSTMPTGH